jgi:hypothetical protein
VPTLTRCTRSIEHDNPPWSQQSSATDQWHSAVPLSLLVAPGVASLTNCHS